VAHACESTPASAPPSRPMQCGHNSCSQARSCHTCVILSDVAMRRAGDEAGAKAADSPAQSDASVIAHRGEGDPGQFGGRMFALRSRLKEAWSGRRACGRKYPQGGERRQQGRRNTSCYRSRRTGGRRFCSDYASVSCLRRPDAEVQAHAAPFRRRIGGKVAQRRILYAAQNCLDPTRPILSQLSRSSVT
jgi:hypothetical protein